MVTGNLSCIALMIPFSVPGRFEDHSLGRERSAHTALFHFRECGHLGGCCKPCPVAYRTLSEHDRRRMPCHRSRELAPGKPWRSVSAHFRSSVREMYDMV